jgi:hypothetical protein
MNRDFTFQAMIEDAGGGGAFVTVPFDVEATFGKKRIKVRSWIDGEFYRGSLVRMRGPQHILGIRKEIRLKIGKQIGDTVEIKFEEDTEPRVVKLSADIEEIINRNPDIKNTFHSLSYTHQREYMEWIEDAKREETRKKRMNQMVDQLRRKTTK